MSREKVKNHEYSFDIGSNPTETVIEMCVCIERLTIKFFERAKHFYAMSLTGFFLSA